MNNIGLFVFIYLNSILNLVYSSSLDNNLDVFKKEYGDGYGIEWIYVPGGDGELHYVNLTMTMDDDIFQGELDTVEEYIEFRLYNGDDNRYILLDKQGRAVNDNEQDVTNHIMRSQLPLKVITHGWKSSADIENILKIKNAYFQAQKVNVITIDWSYTASSIYPWAVYKTKQIGAKIAPFLDALNDEYGVTGDQLHLIGHSLGAHVMGVAASQTKSILHRVTGLDPASPLFEYALFPKHVSEKLDSSDAEIVDVIHTSAGLLGYSGALGTVDFYPNGGGFLQPGCEGILDILQACSHSIAYHYFLESIKNPTIYPAYECDSWQEFLNHRCHRDGYMGEGVNKNMIGNYYLRTTATVPYIFRNVL